MDSEWNCIDNKYFSLKRDLSTGAPPKEWTEGEQHNISSQWGGKMQIKIANLIIVLLIQCGLPSRKQISSIPPPFDLPFITLDKTLDSDLQSILNDHPPTIQEPSALLTFTV